MINKKLIAVACGQEAADLVIKNGLLINVHSAEIYEDDVVNALLQ